MTLKNKYLFSALHRDVFKHCNTFVICFRTIHSMVRKELNKYKNNNKLIYDRRSQIVGQIFIYIMAAIVIGIIILIGYKAVDTMMEKSCAVQQINFKTKIEGFLEKYNSYGSVNKEVMVAPCEYEEICFVDKRAIDLVTNSDKIASCTSSSGNNNNIILDSVNSKIPVTVFAVSKKKTVPLVESEYSWKDIDYTSDTFNLANTYPCTCIHSKNNNFYLTFKGRGAGTIVEETTT